MTENMVTVEGWVCRVTERYVAITQNQDNTLGKGKFVSKQHLKLILPPHLSDIEYGQRIKFRIPQWCADKLSLTFATVAKQSR